MDVRKEPFQEPKDDPNARWAKVINLHVKLFNFLGAFPSEKINSNKITYTIYNIYYLLCLSAKLLVAILVTLNVFDVWKNLAVLSDTLFLCTASLFAGFIGSYYLLNRPKIKKIFEQTDVNVVRNLEELVPEKYRELLNQNARKCMLHVYTMVVWVLLLYVVWIITPIVFVFIPHLLRENEFQNETSYVMLLPMWLPSALKKPPTTDIAFLLQAFDTYLGITLHTSFIVLFLFAVSCATTRFKILSHSIEIVDFYRWMPNQENNLKSSKTKQDISDGTVKNSQVVAQIAEDVPSVLLMGKYSSLYSSAARLSAAEERYLCLYLKIWIKEYQNLLA